MNSDAIDDALTDVNEATKAFEATPNADTLDDVYRTTDAVLAACKKRLAQIESKKNEATHCPG